MSLLDDQYEWNKKKSKKCGLHNVSNCVDEEKVVVDRNTLQWLYNYVKKDRDSDEKTAIIKHLESLGCVY